MEIWNNSHNLTIHDFTVFEDIITETKRNDSIGTDIHDIPDINDTTIMALNQKLINILTDYPWELRLWSKILSTIVLTLLTVVALIMCCICHQHGNCLIEQYLSSKWDNVHKQISNHK